MPKTASTKNKGTVTQVVGVVVDAEFENKLPAIFDALEVEVDGTKLVLEVAQHLSKNSVRAVAMGPTDGLTRGTTVYDSGGPISVPVGDPTLGRVLNVVGEPIDSKPKPKAKLSSIHAEAPELIEQNPTTEILETGIKVIDLICPIIKGGKVGLFGGAGVGKTVFIPELIGILPDNFSYYFYFCNSCPIS